LITIDFTSAGELGRALAPEARVVHCELATFGEALRAASDCLNVEIAPFPSHHLLFSAWRRAHAPPAKPHPVFRILVIRAGQELCPKHDLQLELLDGDTVQFSRVIG
jgi:hypothetical protein